MQIVENHALSNSQPTRDREIREWPVNVHAALPVQQLRWWISRPLTFENQTAICQFS